jgi:uncharacterized membrane protein
MKKHLSIAVLILISIISCTKNSVNSNIDNSTTTCTGTKSFATDVNPIFQTVCATSGCHDAGSTNGPGALTTYQQIFNARSLIRSAILSGTMPKNTTLTADQKNAIICWIDNGATNN